MSKNNHISRYQAICVQCFVKWNLTAAVVVSFTIFFVVFSFSIYEIICPQYAGPRNRYEFQKLLKDPKTELSLGTGKEIHQTGSCYYSTAYNCEIICNNIIVSEINSYIDLFNDIKEENNCLDGNIKLTLEYCIFKNNALDSQWLDGLLPLENIYMTKLEISDKIDGRALTDIQEGAFASNVFQHLDELTFVNTNIQFLKRDAFEGLDELGTFNFRINSGFKNIKFEENVFQHISQTLNILEITGLTIGPEMMQNITGMKAKDPLTKLSIFSLRNNNINKIEGGSFKSAPNLRSLYLDSNGLTVLDVDAFQGLDSIQLLFLPNNNLYTFPENIFKNFIGAPKNISIAMNKFNCDCDLEWFVDYYEKSGYFNGIDFECTTSHGTVSYTEVDFCPDNPSTTEPSSNTDPTTTETFPSTEFTTSSDPTESNTPISTPLNPPSTTTSGHISTITTTTIPTTTDPPLKTVTITCKDASNILAPNSLDDHSNSTATIKTNHLVFNFTQIGMDFSSDRPLYLINFEDALDSDYLLLILEENYSCIVSHDRKNYLLNELEYGQLYTICLASQKTTSVPPKNCASLSVPRAYREQEWLLNKDKSLIIGLTCACMLIISLMSGFLVFCVIRKYPTLIKGSKRVVVVKKKKPSVDVLIMPNYSSSRGAPTTEIPPPSPSAVSSRSDGYMTPQPAFKLPENHVGIYDSSSPYCYCTPLATCRFHKTQGPRPIITNSLYGNCNSNNNEAPPLPPNHPKRRF